MITLKTETGYLAGAVDKKATLCGTAYEALKFDDRVAATDFLMAKGLDVIGWHIEVIDFDAFLKSFVEKCQMLISENERKLFDKVQFNTQLTIDPNGRKYIRIVKSDDFGSRSVYCFVNKETGDVLKADGWKRPAKHARGNIYAADGGLGGMSCYGTAYLR